MTIGIPIQFSFQSSNVLDSAVTLEDLLNNCQAPIFTQGLEIQADEWVYEYNNDVSFTPKVWSQVDADAGIYDLDEVLLKDCKLIKVTGKSGTGITTHQRPKEPEEYGAWDTGVDFGGYSHRYMRVPSTSKNGWLSRTWYSPSRGIYYYMCWETSSCVKECAGGAWRWTAKDLDACSCVGAYNRTCLLDTYSTKYNAATDIKAAILNWGAPSRPKEDIIQFKSMVERDGYFYFRTHLNKKLEYATWETGTAYQYSYMDIRNPSDIEGFIQKRRTNPHAPFDGKNYTRAIVDTTLTSDEATWTLLATEPYNSIAFGNIMCDSIDIKVTDTEGEVLFQLNNYIVSNTISDESDLEFNSTVVLYTKDVMESETVVEITLHGTYVEIGEILGNKSLDAGFTKVAFKNKFKDFSPKEQDQWGNWYYNEEGIRVHVHSGTVEFPILRYDQLTRLMILLGGQKVIINSSDSISNEAPNGKQIFDATMMIARFTTFELSSSEKDKRIGERGSYTFALEELV